jgi:hypothetical protein
VTKNGATAVEMTQVPQRAPSMGLLIQESTITVMRVLKLAKAQKLPNIILVEGMVWGWGGKWGHFLLDVNAYIIVWMLEEG